MKVPDVPADEIKRLQTLRALQILDTAPEERFDRLTRLAKRLFDVPTALVSLVDENRQWFKSRVGMDATETPRSMSFCGHAILGDDLLLIADASLDPRFQDNPLVTGPPFIRFYAGFPLKVANGSKLGTLCLLDTRSRDLSDEDRGLLLDLAHMAEQELAASQLATLDELTTISNRRGFEILAQHALKLAARQHEPATLMFFDLDGFKAVNDSFGHAEGDRALVAFAAAMKEAFRDSDLIGRLGGDEFVALLIDADSAAVPTALERLQRELDAYNAQARRGYDIRFSVGQATVGKGEGRDLAALLRKADAAMYANKQAKKAAA